MDTVSLEKLMQVAEFVWQAVLFQSFFSPPYMHICLLDCFNADKQNSVVVLSEVTILKEQSSLIKVYLTCFAHHIVEVFLYD